MCVCGACVRCVRRVGTWTWAVLALVVVESSWPEGHSMACTGEGMSALMVTCKPSLTVASSLYHRK